jgi:hypothetical protein
MKHKGFAFKEKLDMCHFFSEPGNPMMIKVDQKCTKPMLEARARSRFNAGRSDWEQRSHKPA